MTSTLEERLARAGQTLDRASAEYRSGEGAPRVPAETRQRRRTPQPVSVAAAVVVVVVLVGAVSIARNGSTSDTSPAGPAATAQLAAALDATRAAAAMTVDITSPAGSDGSSEFPVGIWNYGAPDRWEQLGTSPGPRLDSNPPGGVSVRLYLGEETWRADNGRWVPEPAGQAAAPVPTAMFDALARLDCSVEIDELLVAWRGPGATCPNEEPGSVPQLPVGTAVWAVELNPAGQLDEVRTGQVLDFGPDADLSGSTDPLNRLGAAVEASARFWYVNVPEISSRPAE